MQGYNTLRFLCTFFLAYFTLCNALEPVRINSNRTSVEGHIHRPSKTWPEKYLKRDKIVVRVPIKHDTNKTEIDRMAIDHGFENEGPMGKIPHYYIWSRAKSWVTQDDEEGERIRTEREPVSNLFGRLDTSPRVEWWNYMTPRERIKRSWRSPSDPLFSQQWHLRGAHLDVVDVWKNHDVTGRGVNLAIVDDGIQHEHPDLTPNYRKELSWDFNEDDSDPEPFRSDGHGTSAAGVAGAAEDTHCGVGVAHQVNLVGLRLLGAWTSDMDEAQALCHKCDESDHEGTIQIYSNSWGPSDEGKHLGGPGHLTTQAFEYCSANGRQGKGSVYVWAGGNGRFNGDDSNYDGYANSRFTISVAAVDVNGVYTWYSEPGANLLCSAPSSGYRSNSITTTDLLSNWGYSNNGCTDSFGGTSAAAPQIAGVVALMLEARPELGWRDVQHILAHTSRITDERNTVWTTNAAGLSHSHDYGFGVADAEEAVKLALGWELKETNGGYHATSGTLKPHSSNTLEVSDSTRDYLWAIASESHDAQTIKGLEYVTVYVDMSIPCTRKCLDLSLIGPSGVTSQLHSGDAVSAEEKDLAWTFSTVRHWGERLYYTPELDVRDSGKMVNNGRWALRAKDLCRSARICQGGVVLNHWKLDFYGE